MTKKALECVRQEEYVLSAGEDIKKGVFLNFFFLRKIYDNNFVIEMLVSGWGKLRDKSCGYKK